MLKKKTDWLIYSPIVLFSYPITSNTSTISSCGRASSSPIPSIAGSINNRNVPNVEVICKKVGLEPDRSWVHLKKSVWLKSITSCKLFLKNHIIQLINSVLNKSTINKREISTGINHIFNLFWSPVLVESWRRKTKKTKWVYDLPLLLRRNHKIFKDSKWELKRKCVSYLCFKLGDVSIFKG